MLVDVADKYGPSSILIFPNPTSGEATLVFETTGQARPSISVFNTYSQLVFDKKLPGQQKGQVNIDLRNHPPGLYFVRVMFDDKIVFTGRLVSIH